MAPARPLQGIVVLDLTRFLPGAVATLQLASFGAEVIKIERPGSGDPARNFHGAPWLFQETNRGKKSLAIDLTDPRGTRIFTKLVSTADVLIESFRPNVMKRLGLSREMLRKQNPRLIYAALSGYGRSGPYAEMPGHDLNYVAMNGVLDLISAPNHEPTIPRIQIADLAVGSAQIVIGILLALQDRERSGQGQCVDVSLATSVASLLAFPLTEMRAGEHRAPGTGLLSGAYACYSLYRAKDGRWLALGALEPKFWANICRELRCLEFAQHQFDPEPAQSRMKKKLAALFATRSANRWFCLLKGKDSCLTPVRTFEEAAAEGLIQHDQLGATLSRTHGPIPKTHAPRLGEHSLQILRRCGVSQSELRALREAKVVQSHRAK
jgi:crotonobetainyl-CoA:carnitine CoA-transferase CaiB-like acyl-CoA transferase